MSQNCKCGSRMLQHSGPYQIRLMPAAHLDGPALGKDRRRTQCLGFHQDRLRATPATTMLPQLQVHTRHAESEAELLAAAWLRARSFYVYRKDRAFAGQRYQEMKAGEEFERLCQQPARAQCMVAVADKTQVEGVDDKLCLEGTSALVGSLDVLLTSRNPEEWLVGKQRSAAYLMNVCSAECARRRGVGQQLVSAAISSAQASGVRHLQLHAAHAMEVKDAGVAALYVHLMAVNEIGRALYASQGFTIEQEETDNQAHYRGHCLDGIEGKGRTILMRLDL